MTNIHHMIMRCHCRLHEIQHYYSYFKQTMLSLKKNILVGNKTSFVMTVFASAIQTITYYLERVSKRLNNALCKFFFLVFLLQTGRCYVWRTSWNLIYTRLLSVFEHPIIIKIGCLLKCFPPWYVITSKKIPKPSVSFSN